MDKGTSQTELISVLAIATSFVMGLHQLGGIEGLAIDWSSPAGWVDGSCPEDVVGATLRSIGLVVGYWLLATTALYTITGARGAARRPRWVAALTLPGIRRIVDRALATALAASLAVAPMSPTLARADSPPPAPAVCDASDGIPVPHVTYTPTTSGPAANNDEVAESATAVIVPHPVPVTTSIPHSTVATSTLPTATQTHIVRRGDNLWTIARNHLRVTVGADVGQDRTTQYWRLLVDTNRDTLRSGDPNLIFPGELIALPAIGAEE